MKKSKIVFWVLMVLLIFFACSIGGFIIHTEVQKKMVEGQQKQQKINECKERDMGYIVDDTKGTVQCIELYGEIIEPSITRCYAIVWGMGKEGINRTCRCTETHYNFSYCDEFTYMKYCMDELGWKMYLSDDYFREQIYPYLKYDCEED